MAAFDATDPNTWPVILRPRQVYSEPGRQGALPVSRDLLRRIARGGHIRVISLGAGAVAHPREDILRLAREGISTKA
jgi:hypothetical protein